MTATFLQNEADEYGNNSMPDVAPRNKSRGALRYLGDAGFGPISLPGRPLMPDPRHSLLPK